MRKDARDQIERKLTAFYIANRQASVRATILHARHFATLRHRELWGAAIESPDDTALSIGMKPDELAGYSVVYVAEREVPGLERQLIEAWQLSELRVRLRDLWDQPWSKPEEGIAAVREAISEIEAGGPPKARSHREVGLQLVDEWLRGMTEDRRTVPTPFPFLNKAVGGYVIGKLHLVSAITSGHKTTVARMSAWHASDRGRVLFWTMEDGEQDMAARTIAAETKRVDTRTLYTYQRPTQDEAGEFEALLREVEESLAVERAKNLHYMDEPTPTLSRVLGAIAAEAARGDLVLAVLDFLQLIQPDQATQHLSEREHLFRVTAQLSALAHRLKIPILATVQPKQDDTHAQESTGRPIVMSSMRGGSAIAQNAWAVILLNRPWDKDNGLNRHKLEITVAKWKSGESGLSKTLDVRPNKDLIFEE